MPRSVYLAGQHDRSVTTATCARSSACTMGDARGQPFCASDHGTPRAAALLQADAHAAEAGAAGCPRTRHVVQCSRADCVVRGWTFAARPSVLLVHGWGGNAGQMSAFVAPLLERGYGVVVADMPGHGRSSGRLTSLVLFRGGATRAVGSWWRLARSDRSFVRGAAGTTLALRDGLDVARVAYVAPPARFNSFWDRFRRGVEVSEPVFARMVTNAGALARCELLPACSRLSTSRRA